MMVIQPDMWLTSPRRSTSVDICALLVFQGIEAVEGHSFALGVRGVDLATPNEGLPERCETVAGPVGRLPNSQGK